MPNNTPDFDLLVIGAGSGGLAAAKRAASYGARVAIVESSRVGGTCVIRGCIPKKLMVYAAQLGASRRLAQAYGWRDSLGELSWPDLVTFRNAAVLRLEEMHERNLAKAGVTLLEGHARLLDAHQVAVGEDTLQADKILIATGARPIHPPLPGASAAISSDGFWDLPERPSSATIIGGGYIAVEFASILQGLGCSTTLLVRSRILREFDASLGEHLSTALQRQGVRVHQGAAIQHIEGGTVAFHDAEGQPQEVTSDACVLFAAGRAPNTEGLGLENAGVVLNQGGAIEVDAEHRTSAPHIFAVGDVIGQAQLTPVAIRAGRNVADQEFGPSSTPMSYDDIPTAIFSCPPVGTVGLSEAQAQERHGDDLDVFQATFNPMLYSPCAPEDKVPTFMKLLVQRSTDRVLGFHMVGDDAPEIIQGFAAALKAGVTKTQLDSTTAIHPTAAEEFVLMR